MGRACAPDQETGDKLVQGKSTLVQITTLQLPHHFRCLETSVTDQPRQGGSSGPSREGLVVPCRVVRWRSSSPSSLGTRMSRSAATALIGHQNFAASDGVNAKAGAEACQVTRGARPRRGSSKMR